MAENDQQPTNDLPQLDFTTSHAFIIGIDEYEDRNIPSLKTAVNDASKLAEVLAKQQQFTVHAPLLNVKRSEIENLFKSLPEVVGEKNRVFFYYAGHGVAVEGADGRPDGYLVPAAASAKDIAGSAVSMDVMYKTLDALGCNHLFLVLDCCFAGAFRWSSNTRDLLSIAPKSLYQRPAWVSKEPLIEIIFSLQKNFRSQNASTQKPRFAVSRQPLSALQCRSARGCGQSVQEAPGSGRQIFHDNRRGDEYGRARQIAR